MFSVMLTVDKTITESQCIDGAKCLPPIIIKLAFLTEKAALLWKISVNSRILLIYVSSLLKDFVQTYKTEKRCSNV